MSRLWRRITNLLLFQVFTPEGLNTGVYFSGVDACLAVSYGVPTSFDVNKMKLEAK